MTYNILLPLAFSHGFDYRAPEGMQVKAGDWVRVSFGRKSIWGVVWGKGEGGFDEKKIKTIERVAAHLPPMSDAMRAFIDWVAWYTLSPKGMVLKMAIPIPEALEPPEMEAKYIASGQPVKTTPARTRILAYLSDNTPRSTKEITAHAKVSAAVVREFVKAGGLAVQPSSSDAHSAFGNLIRCTRSPARLGLAEDDGSPILSPDQQSAADVLRSKLTGFSVSVIDGVTGSGKTEVYFDTIAATLAAGKQALVLLPEIALSIQWLSRFKERFGFAPELWHSGVGQAKRRGAWQRIAEGEALVTVGARSALFLPYRNLGLIVIDEEHDQSYKQEEGVIYHARDMAVARARQEKIPAVLVSATPSLETEVNIQRGRYQRLHLMSRHGEAEMPHVRLVDMRTEPLPHGAWLSDALRGALITTVQNKKQAMLFMNRRGYAPLLICRTCGHRFQCPQCSAGLVLHRSRGKLVCHHCGHIAPIPKQCPDCKAEESFVACGPGVERVAEEARALLPEARIEIMTSDHTDTPEKADILVKAMERGEIDILIGTQMIAKGHHFANLALVGVVDADMGLGGGDLRAGERTYQLLHQVSGRAGREKTPGEVWLQTYLPDHPVMQALVAGDRDRFMQAEAQMREEAHMPPFGKLAAIIVEGKNEAEVGRFARELVKGGFRDQASGIGEKNSIVPNPQSLTPNPLILGPAPAPLSLLRGKHRYRILVKAPRDFALQPFLAQWLLTQKTPSSLRVKVDVDPYSFI